MLQTLLSPRFTFRYSCRRSSTGLLSALAVSVAALFLSAAVLQAAPEYVEGEVIVTFKPSETLETAKRALDNNSVAFTKRLSGLSERRKRQTGLVREKTKTTAQLMAALKADPSVESVEPNYLRHFDALPNDTRFSEMWGLNNTGQKVENVTGIASDDVKFLAARALSKTATDEIVVAVIDSGVDPVHPDLAANIWVNPLEKAGNGKDDDGNGYRDDIHGYDFDGGSPDSSDSGYHGTHVSGTIAAVGNNGAGVIGISDKVKILPLRISSDGEEFSTFAEIEALDYATALRNRGVNIVAINASYGGGYPSDTEQDAIQAAGDAGIIMVCAAGNDGLNNDNYPHYPASYQLSNQIVVAASTSTDSLASFSDYGANTVNLAAPGVSILSTQPSTFTLQAGGVPYSFSTYTNSGLTTGFGAPIIDCGDGNSAADFPAKVSGGIALVRRGTQSDSSKVSLAMAAGAKAVFIYNNVSGGFSGSLPSTGNWVPTYAIPQSAGLAIKAKLPSNGGVVVTGNYQYLDGTSMATPHVTGAVAFAALNFPADTMARRRLRILSAVDVIPDFQGRLTTGGRLNLLKIVDANGNGVPDWRVIVTTAALAGGRKGVDYSRTLTATGGAAPYTWSLTSGELPAGLSLSSSGVISGTPSDVGTAKFVVTATDQAAVSSKVSLSISILYPVMAITTTSLPAGTVGVDYSPQTIGATGGSEVYTWKVSAGTLPYGLTLDSTTGLLSGQPVKAGKFNFSIAVTDTAKSTTAKAYSVTIAPGVTPYQPLEITTASVDAGGLRTPYSLPLAGSEGWGAYTWQKASGTLPPGLTLTPAGVLSGTPTAAGTYKFTVRLLDGAQDSVTKEYTVTIAPLPDQVIGSFTGYIARQPSVNSNLGGYFVVTTTKAGTFSAKLVQGSVTHAVAGKLVSSLAGPSSITATLPWGTLGTETLQLTLDPTTNSAVGTLSTAGGTAVLTGWRKTFLATHPPTAQLGRYSASIDLGDSTQVGDAAIPQGSGYLHLLVPTTGTVTITGRSSDGGVISGSTFLGPSGEVLIYSSRDSGKGSLGGVVKVETAAATTDNVLDGNLTWSKPAITNARLYPAGFDPIALAVSGKYSGASTGSVIALGLPAFDLDTKVLFTEGGVSAAATNPNTTFKYSSAYKVSFPTVGNPATVTLAVNKVDGSLSGTFKLTDGSLTRTATFQGSIVRLTDGTVKGTGYFLLPQIPAVGKTPATAPILSGRVLLTQ